MSQQENRLFMAVELSKNNRQSPYCGSFGARFSEMLNGTVRHSVTACLDRQDLKSSVHIGD